MLELSSYSTKMIDRDLPSVEEIVHLMRKEHGLFPKIGIEHEYYLEGHEDDIEMTIKDVQLYCDRFEREKGWHQFESILEYTDNLAGLAKRAHEMKNAIMMLARKNGVHPNFSAKPHQDDYGSALHFHLSLHYLETGYNAFSEGTLNENKLIQKVISSLLVNTFLIIKHTCTREEDFGRFQSNFMAPTHISWGGNNRTTVIRVPDAKAEFRRIEYRLFPASADFDTALKNLLYYAYLGLSADLPEFERVYGNAHDAQYSLTEIPKSLTELNTILGV